MTRNYQLPQGRRIHVFRSGDAHFEGIKINYNPNLYKKQEKFLDEIQEKIPFPGAVRSIHTPNSGTEVTDFRNLERDAKYVAAGKKGFINIRGGYDSIGKPIRKRNKDASVKVVKKRRMKRSKKIWVYQNGSDKIKALPFAISGRHNEDWSSFLYRVSEGVKMPGGGVGKMFDLKGKIIDSMEDLEYNGNYVASLKNDLFRPVDYLKIGKDFSRRQSDGDKDDNDGVKSPGMKLRMPKSTKFKSRRSKSLPQNDALGSTPDISPRRRKSRSESRARKKRGRRSRRASLDENDDQTGGESDVDFSLLSGRNTSVKSQTNSPLKGILKNNKEDRSQSPGHFYETLSKLEISDGDVQGKREGSGHGSDEEEHSKFQEEDADSEDGEEDEDDNDDDDDDDGDDDGSHSEGDSGRGSIFRGEEERLDSLFRAKHKSRPSTTVSVDLDVDEGGIFRAKSKSGYGKDAKTVLEDRKLKVDLPIDLLEPKEVMEEVH